MAFRKYLNNVLKLLDEPLSVIELAKAECLPPVLHISNIALLMHPDSENLQKAYEAILKGLINRKILPVITVEEYVELSIELDSQMDASDFAEPPPPDHVHKPNVFGVMHSDKDELKEDKMLNVEKRRVYVVERNAMKNFLKSENEWPLAESNLLSRWWPESIHKKNSLCLKSKISKNSINKMNAEYLFHRNNTRTWEIRFAGLSCPPLREKNGYHYIMHLLKNPNKHISRIELHRILNPDSNKEKKLHDESYLDQGLNIKTDFVENSSPDQKAEKAYQDKAEELIMELNEAKMMDNYAKIYKIEEEMKFLKAEIYAAKQAKKGVIGSKIKKKQKENVYKAINSAVGSLEKIFPEFHQYLRDHIKSVGTDYIYTPPKPEPAWYF